MDLLLLWVGGLFEPPAEVGTFGLVKLEVRRQKNQQI